MNPVGALTTVSSTLNGASNILQGLSSIGGVLINGDFWSQLRPVSYRGVPFAVLEGDASFGRRNAIHTYPFRDGAWIEDLGKQARRVTLIGFVVGDDAIAQRNRLIQAVETPGNGELVHATLGRMTVNVLEFSTHERWDKGRMFEVRLVCMTSVPRIWPAAAASTTDAVTTAASGLSLSSIGAFISNIGSALQYGATVAEQAVATVQKWAKTALTIAQAASSAYHLIAGAVSGPGSLLSGFSLALSQLTSSGNTALSDAAQVGDSTTATTFAQSAQTSVADAVASAGGSKQQIAAASQLAGYTAPVSVTGIPQAGSVGADQTALLYRRAAVAQMAIAVSSYQPASSDEATTIRGQLLDVIDAAILEAGNAGDDDVYASLITLKTASIQDLAAKSTGLPSMINYSFQATLPAVVLAQRLYQDSTRADELAQSADAIHPAFMPRTFKALSS